MKWMLKTVLPCAALAARGAAQAEERVWPTPGIAHVDDLGIPDALAFGIRGTLGNGSVTVGPAAACATEGPRHVEATAFFGWFPRDRRPAQLTVRIPDGTVLRFDPVVRGGPEAALHSTRTTDPVGRGAQPRGRRGVPCVHQASGQRCVCAAGRRGSRRRNEDGWEKMTGDAESDVKANEAELERREDLRKSRSIRFSDAEWEEVRRVALAHGAPPSAFVRDMVLAVLRDADVVSGDAIRGPARSLWQVRHEIVVVALSVGFILLGIVVGDSVERGEICVVGKGARGTIAKSPAGLRILASLDGIAVGCAVGDDDRGQRRWPSRTGA